MEEEFAQRFGAATDSSPLPPHLRKRKEVTTPARSVVEENTAVFESSPIASTMSTPRKDVPATATAASQFTTYNQDFLKQIGVGCAKKLPPASAIQAMFLYEMQRQTEAEKLFHAQMFELARAEDHTHVQDRRIAQLEKHLADLERKTAARDVEERIATSAVRLNAHQEKLNVYDGRMDTVLQELEELKRAQENAAATNAAASTSATNAASTAGEDMATMKEEINVLFEDRDGILRMINEVKDSIGRLEKNVHALTLQRSSGTSSPASTHRVPIKTPNGELIDLSIPKGNAAFGLKENRPLQTFQPGKQWGA